MRFFRFHPLAILLVLTGAAAPVVAAAEPLELSVRFGPGKTILSGTVDTEASAADLESTLSQARPDLAVDRSGLSIDPAARMPGLSDLRSLLAELGLSTIEGRLEISKDRLLISGLTDSVVTQSALRIRSAPVLEGRAYHSRLCIVETEALPVIGASLTQAGPVPLAEPVVPHLPEKPFETPGIRLEDLLPTLRMLGRLGELSGKPAPALTSVNPIRAEPMAASVGGEPVPPAVAEPVLPALPTHEALPSIFFSRNSFLLQANQAATIASVAKTLLSVPRLGLPVRIEAVRAEGGSSAFNEYLCERRVAEVTRLLTEQGVAGSVVTGAAVSGGSSVDGGEVRISVELPPPPPPPKPGTTAGTAPTTESPAP